ncbi:MAG: TetR/AcrR family transcriptional regulator C-terminal domain-containing protein [Nocardia sp.]|nr:TetR/AcrR family transcriptional regulator C-terminal domain-containing protein [Nocardia sp.]
MAAPTALDLLWGTPDRPRRGPRPSLSLDRIVTEAIALADADGFAAVSMQRLAERLGCAKMALYRYVPGKAELTAVMLDQALGAPPHIAETGDRSWRTALAQWSHTIHARYRAHPWAIELTTARTRPLGPNEMAWMEAALAALADTGLSGAERLDTVVLLNGHIRSLVQQTAASGPEEAESLMADQVGAVLHTHADRFPEIAAAYSATGGDRGAALDYGIDRILDGVGVLIERRGS